MTTLPTSDAHAAEQATPAATAVLWGPNGRRRTSRAEISIMSARPNPQALRDLGSSWLHELVAVLGSEQVQALSGEVA